MNLEISLKMSMKSSLRTRDVMVESIMKTKEAVAEIGKKQFEKFRTERIDQQIKEIEDPIKSKMPLFRTAKQCKKCSKEDTEKTFLRYCTKIFSQLYIATQTRNGDQDTFFMHETNAHPLLSVADGKLRSGVKTDLVSCLKEIESSEMSLKNGNIFSQKTVGKLLEGSVFRQYSETRKAKYIQ